MTKDQYLSFGNEQFLTDEEKACEKETNVKNHYGLSDHQLINLVLDHAAARKAEAYGIMARIEYRLTDINFHWECGKMHRGEYDEIRSRLKKGGRHVEKALTEE